MLLKLLKSLLRNLGFEHQHDMCSLKVTSGASLGPRPNTCLSADNHIQWEYARQRSYLSIRSS